MSEQKNKRGRKAMHPVSDESKAKAAASAAKRIDAAPESKAFIKYLMKLVRGKWRDVRRINENMQLRLSVDDVDGAKEASKGFYKMCSVYTTKKAIEKEFNMCAGRIWEKMFINHQTHIKGKGTHWLLNYDIIELIWDALETAIENDLSITAIERMLDDVNVMVKRKGSYVFDENGVMVFQTLRGEVLINAADGKLLLKRSEITTDEHGNILEQKDRLSVWSGKSYPLRADKSLMTKDAYKEILASLKTTDVN